MSDRSSEGALGVLQVGTLDQGGGAASVAQSLTRGLRARGHRSWLAVGRRMRRDSDAVLIPDDRRVAYRATGYARFQRRLASLAGRSPGRGWGLIGRSLRLATHPRALVDQLSGREDFEFPGTRDLLKLISERPDVVHCHNLHGGFFDLRALSWLSHEAPTVLTLHDAWLLTGHCAQPFDCERWATGCGSCPDLSIYPAIRRDRTASNWTRKRDIYSASRLYVTTPSTWLMDCVRRSMLAPAVEMSRVIPNGVDLSIFKPEAKEAARRSLGLEPGVPTVLFISGERDKPWLDHETLGASLKRIADANRSLSVVAIGEETPHSEMGKVRWVPYEKDPRRMAGYYQAADAYLHCARAATFPVSILEALACGTPVVATAVGGVVEEIRSCDASADPTGILVPGGRADLLADAVIRLLGDPELGMRLADNAVRDVRARFDVNHQVNGYLDWYRTIIDHWKTHVRLDRIPAAASAGGPVGLAVD